MDGLSGRRHAQPSEGKSGRELTGEEGEDGQGLDMVAVAMRRSRMTVHLEMQWAATRRAMTVWVLLPL